MCQPPHRTRSTDPGWHIKAQSKGILPEKEPCSVCAGHSLDVEKPAGCHSSKGLPAYAPFLSNSHPFPQGCVTQRGMAAAAVTWCGAPLSAGECPALRVRWEYLISSPPQGQPGAWLQPPPHPDTSPSLQQEELGSVCGLHRHQSLKS